jgi:ParB family chromosome partitioning protein
MPDPSHRRSHLADASAAGLTEVWVYLHAFESEQQALEYAIRNQRNRRNLTAGEILRCVAALDQRGDKTTNLRQNQTDTPIGVSEKPSSHATADLLGISPRQVERVRTVLDHAPEDVKTAVLTGEKSIHRAYVETQEARIVPAEIRTEVMLAANPLYAPLSVWAYPLSTCSDCGHTIPGQKKERE